MHVQISYKDGGYETVRNIFNIFFHKPNNTVDLDFLDRPTRVIDLDTVKYISAFRN